MVIGRIYATLLQFNTNRTALENQLKIWASQKSSEGQQVMWEEWGSCLFSCNFYPPFGAHSSCPLLCRCVPADSKSKERCAKSLLYFPCFHGLCAVGLLHICMCCGYEWFAQIVVEKSFLFSKIYLDSWLWSALIFKRFLPHFTSLILEFLKKIGHTGIANTKKWLDQAVFPCWSNYHTLAGE